MAYCAEMCYLGIVGHDIELRFKDGFLMPRGIDVNF
jgi:hypothetical protein